ncbi:MAG: hypothetical protein ACTSUE_06590 [Promethearchaeota archaeon]
MERLFEHGFDKIRDAFKIILEEYGVADPGFFLHVVDELDFNTSKKVSTKLISKLTREGYEMAIDLTPGRKPIIAGILYSLKDFEGKGVAPRRLYYLAIKKVEGSNRPYDMLPGHMQELTNFLDPKA